MEIKTAKKGNVALSKQAICQLNLKINELVKETDSPGYAENQEISTVSDVFANRMLLAAVIRKGVPFEVFALIQQISAFSPEEWSEFLNLSAKTLQRYRQYNRRFKPIHSEKIIELAEVTTRGMEVFENNGEQLNTWLTTPNFALGNRKPVDFLDNSYGKELVLNELGRIEHGIFA